MGPNVRRERRAKGREAAFGTSARWRGLDARLGRDERERFGIANRLHREIHVEEWPIQMIGRWPLDVGKLFDGCLLEPGKLLEGQVQLLLPEEQPEAMHRYVGDFRRGSDGARHRYFASHAARSAFIFARSASRVYIMCPAS